MDTANASAGLRTKSASSMPAFAAPRRRTRANTDTVKLLMLGYKQELEREFTLFNSFGSSFTLLSSLTSLSGTYSIGITYGGPVVMIWGWLLVTLFATSVGLSMAELASAYPTSGALYYWSYKLAPPRLRNLACWMTAWILTLGQAALSASAFYTFVHLLATAAEVQYGVTLTSTQTFAILMGLAVVTGLLNLGTARLTAFMITLGTMWHIAALVAFCACVLAYAPARQPAKYVLTSWQPHSEITGISSPVYTTLVGLLMSQSCYIGYDGSAHLAEETFDAEYNVPRAILRTCAGMGVSGIAFLLTFISVKLDVAALLDPGNETHGSNPVLQILLEIAKHDGYVNSGVTLFSIPIVAAFFCSYQSIANNSRMLYAFARDNGVPLADYAKRVHPRTKAPCFAVLYMVLLSVLLSTPMCFNAYVFPAILSFAVVGCYLAYAMPVLCKLATGRRFFLPGPFYLGPWWSYVNNIITTIWVLTMTVVFMLPQFYPITQLNLNWSAPILGAALIFSLGWFYFPKYGARTWFIGPRANLGQFQDVLPSERARKAAEMEAAEAAAAVAAGNAARAAAEADDLMTRVANGTCGGGAPAANDCSVRGGSSAPTGNDLSVRGMLRSSAKSFTTGPARTVTDTEAGHAVGGLESVSTSTASLAAALACPKGAVPKGAVTLRVGEAPRREAQRRHLAVGSGHDDTLNGLTTRGDNAFVRGMSAGGAVIRRSLDNLVFRRAREGSIGHGSPRRSSALCLPAGGSSPGPSVLPLPLPSQPLRLGRNHSCGGDAGAGDGRSHARMGGANAASSSDNRLWAPEVPTGRERGARRTLVPRMEPWSVAGTGAQEGPTDRARERLSLLVRAIAGSMAGTYPRHLREVQGSERSGEAQGRPEGRASVSVVLPVGPRMSATAAFAAAGAAGAPAGAARAASTGNLAPAADAAALIEAPAADAGLGAGAAQVLRWERNSASWDSSSNVPD